MTRCTLMALMILAISCAPHTDSTAPADDTAETTTAGEAFAPATWEELADVRLGGILDEEVQLVDGRWEGEPFAEGGASRPAVGLVDDFLLLGDLTGDGNSESAALVWTSSGGSGTFDYIAVAGRDGQGAATVIDTAELGDRVKVRAGRIVEGRLELDVVQAGPEDAACCPSQLATRSWSLDNGRLAEAEAEITGTLSSSVLEGTEWVLTSFGQQERAPAEPRVTMTVEDGRASGSAGCNRYFTDIQDGDEMPASLSLGPVGSTRMMCPEEIMAVEDRFLQELGKVSSFSFVGGRLVLSWQDGDEFGSLSFSPGEPGAQ